MKQILLITIILLLQSFPSFGNPNGIGILCETTKTNPFLIRIFGFWLDGKNNVNFIRYIDWDVYDHFKGRYYSKDFSISLYFPKEFGYGGFTGDLILNRETGKLKNIDKTQTLFNSHDWICNRVSSNEKDLKLNIKIKTKQREKIEEMEKKKRQKESYEKFKDRLNKRKF